MVPSTDSPTVPQAPKPVIGRPFQKNQSGNPTGYSKKRRAIDKKFQEKAQAWFNANGWKELLSMIESGGEDRRFAVKLLADFSLIKPTLKTEVSGPDGGPINVSLADLVKLAKGAG